MYQTASTLSSIEISAEYVIYAYLKEEDENAQQHCWKRIKTGDDPIEMKRDAYDLFQTQDYKKIEIQKKFFDKKSGHQRVATFHVFENKAQTDYYILSSALLLVIASAGLFYLNMM